MQFDEMGNLDRAFQALRAQKPEFPMPGFEKLYSQMPSWEQVHSYYNIRKKNEGAE